jgi:type VI secretion system protein
MALRLRIVSEHATRLGQQGTKVFGVHGGTIGRATDNDWILPDPERYLSGKHARVEFRAGTYVLIDTSSNGTYVNGAQVPLGKFHDYSMKDGDYVRLGEYELLVSIDTSNDFPPDDSAIVAYDGHSSSSAVKKSTDDDIGADLDLSELLEPSDQMGAGVSLPAHNAYGQSVLSGVEAPVVDGLGSGTPWHMMTRPFKIENAAKSEHGPSPQQRPQNTTLYEGDFDIGLASFCRGAGIDPRAISPEVRGAALQLAGQILREAVLGLMDLNHGRHEFRNRFRIPEPAADGPEAGVNFSHGVDDALLKLVTTVSTRAGSVEAIRENFRELKAQNTAMQSAMHAAFVEFLNRLDPKDLEERFERSSKRGVFGSQNRNKYWELYAEMYAGLAQRPPDGYPHLFIETFARNFEAKLRALAPPRRAAFGADAREPDDPDSKAIGDF